MKALMLVTLSHGTIFHTLRQFINCTLIKLFSLEIGLVKLQK